MLAQPRNEPPLLPTKTLKTPCPLISVELAARKQTVARLGVYSVEKQLNGDGLRSNDRCQEARQPLLSRSTLLRH
jgi:hypothetical protein